MNFQTPPSLDLMKWLTHASTESLRILELERDAPPPLLDFLVEAHGPTLESLAVPACSSHEHALLVQRCPQLREIRTENPAASPMMYRGLPSAVEHIALGLGGETALQPVLDAAKARSALRAITVQMWSGSEDHPQLAALKIACAYQGIDLRITRDVRHFRNMVVRTPPPSQRPLVLTLGIAAR